MTKLEKEYLEEFGDIPKDQIDRIDWLLKVTDISKSKMKLFDEIKRIRKIGTHSLSYTIYLIPKPTPRPRLGNSGVFYVKNAKENKKIFEDFMSNQDISLITTPTEFTCRCYLPIPKSMSTVEKYLAELGFIHPISKPDVDNLAKAYSDMIQDLLIYDDALIWRMVSEKYYSVKPRIEVEITYKDENECKYNINKLRKDKC